MSEFSVYIRITDEYCSVRGESFDKVVTRRRLGIDVDELHRRGFRGVITVEGEWNGNARQSDSSRDELEESQG